MPTYQTTVTNQTFNTRAPGDYEDDRHAVDDAMKGAIAIGSDEIAKGEPVFMAEIAVEKDGWVVDHRVVAIATSRLK